MSATAPLSGPPAWISHPVCARHLAGVEHPEQPRRLAVIEERMRASGLAALMQQIEAPRATPADLARVHSAAVISRVLEGPGMQEHRWLDADTALTAASADAALHAAGAALLGVDLVLDRQASFVFCATRPPGHHAERERSMGFCLFNSVAVAAAHALHRGLQRVAILDFDVHYGNGTADIFRHDERVLLCSSYQDGIYPGWQGDAGASGLIDVPLQSGTGGTELRSAVEQVWRPAMATFRPELILVSAGFDAHEADPLAGLSWSEDDYAWLAGFIRDFAAEHCAGRVVATLEGGYELQALARSVEAFVEPFVRG